MISVILAAGKGTRLGDISNHIPKALLPMSDGTPLIRYICSHLPEGPKTIVVSHLGEMIANEMKNAAEIVWQPTDTYGTAAALQTVKHITEPFLMTFADTIMSEKDYKTIISPHDCLATLGTRRITGNKKAAIITSEDNIITSIKEPEKPIPFNNDLAFAGLAIFHPKIFSYIEEFDFSNCPEYNLMSVLAAIKNETIRSYELQEDFIDIGTPETLPYLKEMEN